MSYDAAAFLASLYGPVVPPVAVLVQDDAGLADKPVAPSRPPGAAAPCGENSPCPAQLPAAPCAGKRRLIGCWFEPISTRVPPRSIWADPPTNCPTCKARRVMPELREMTRDQCWDCWMQSQSTSPRS